MTDIITDVEAYRLLLRQLGEAQAEIERQQTELRLWQTEAEREVALWHNEVDRLARGWATPTYAIRRPGAKAMTDIVERLRRDLMEISYDDIEVMVREAATEIERLRANEAASIFAFRETNDIALEEIKRLRADNAILRNYLREIQAYANLALIDERQDSEILPPD